MEGDDDDSYREMGLMGSSELPIGAERERETEREPEPERERGSGLGLGFGELRSTRSPILFR